MARTVALKMVVLVIPKGAEEKAMLEEDLKWMGCHGFMLRSWSIKYEKIVLELQQKRGNQWQGIVRQDPEKWTVAAWRKVYNFSFRGEGMATQGKKYAEGKFANPPHPKDDYFLPKCKDSRARRMLEFVIPIFYPEKPSRVTVMVGNTMFGVYMGKRKVDWALVMRDMVRRLLTRIGKSKPTPIYSYLLHLYIAYDTIQLKDKRVYMVGESLMLHDIKLEKDEQPAGLESSKRENLGLGEVREL